MRNKFYEVVWAIIRPIVLLFHPIDVKGLDNLPEEPVVICANHSSNWDPILMILAMSQQTKLRIMAKEQLFRIPVVNAFIRKMGAFPVNRGHSDISAVRTSIQSLKAGFHLLIVLGAKEREKFEARAGEFLPETLRQYEAATTFHDGKWVYFNVEDGSVLEDYKKILAIKRRPRPIKSE